MRAQIVSPPFACGVAWPVNVLLELGIKTTNLSFESDHWIETDTGTAISDRAREHFKWYFPILRRCERFTFMPDVEVTWEHRLALANNTSIPTILFVRDPRDAIYSLYKRNYSHALSYIDYLRRPDVWPDHFPDLFKLPPADTYAYFCLFWMTMAKVMNVKVIRFEDMRANPVSVVRDMLMFLEIDANDSEIARALAKSTFEKAKHTMETCQRETGTVFATARKGQVGEWRETHGPEELACFRGPANYLMSQLGYEVQGDDNVAEMAARIEQGIDRLNPIISRLFEAIMQLDMEGKPSSTSVETIRLVARLFETGSADRMWCGALLESYNWVNKIFSDRDYCLAQRVAALKEFVMLNGCYSSLPSISFAMADALDLIGYQRTKEGH